MLEDLSHERFRWTEKCSSDCWSWAPSPAPAITCLTDLVSMQSKLPPSPIGVPSTAERDSQLLSGQNSPHSPQSEHRAQHSAARHAGKCCFIQNIHKEQGAGTHRAQATPPSKGLAEGCGDDRQAGPVTGCQMYYLFLVWPGSVVMLLMML